MDEGVMVNRMGLGVFADKHIMNSLTLYANWIVETENATLFLV